MNQEIRELISRYLMAATVAVERGRRSLGVDDLWAAYSREAIPKRGELPGGGTYRFHSVGCYFDFPDMRIDIDFGPQGSTDCFDAWRLVRFARENGGPTDLEIKDAAAELAALKDQGELIQHPDWGENVYSLQEKVKKEKKGSGGGWGQKGGAEGDSH